MTRKKKSNERNKQKTNRLFKINDVLRHKMVTPKKKITSIENCRKVKKKCAMRKVRKKE